MIPSALSIITTTFEEGVERNKALGIWALGGLGFVLTLYAQQVLGYAAVRFGLTSLVFPVMAALGSILGLSIVLRPDRPSDSWSGRSMPTPSASPCYL